jgi:hypothetical protein
LQSVLQVAISAILHKCLSPRSQALSREQRCARKVTHMKQVQVTTCDKNKDSGRPLLVWTIVSELSRGPIWP